MAACEALELVQIEAERKRDAAGLLCVLGVSIVLLLVELLTNSHLIGVSGRF
jgi:hypothetical protein